MPGDHVPCLGPAPAERLSWGEGMQGADGWGGTGKAWGAVAQNGPVNPQRTTLADSMGVSHQKQAAHRQLEVFSLTRAN